MIEPIEDDTWVPWDFEVPLDVATILRMPPCAMTAP